MLENLIRVTRYGTGAKKVILFFAFTALAVVVLGGELALRSDLVEPSASSGGAMTQAAENIPPDAEKYDADSQYAVETGLTGSIFADNAEAAIRQIPPPADEAEMAQTKKSLDAGSLPAQEGGFVYSSEIPMSYELQEYTYQKCVERGLEYELVLAVMWRESRFMADAVNQNRNGTQDSGIMQINDVNKEWLFDKYGIDDLMDPYQNIDAGTAMLGDLTVKYGAHGAMLAYQYGEVGMARQIRDGYTTSNLVELAYRQRDYYRRII